MFRRNLLKVFWLVDVPVLFIDLSLLLPYSAISGDYMVLAILVFALCRSLILILLTIMFSTHEEV